MPESSQRRKGQIHHVDIDSPGGALTPDPDVTDVLLIAHHDGAVIGQSWLPAASTVSARELKAALERFEAVAERRRIRAQIERAIGRPQPNRSPRRTVSVIVCTKDRPDQLEGCLRSILALDRPGLDLLVVDNGSSTPATAEVCESLGVRVVVETKPGQTSARNRGVLETTGELVAFTDDDVIVESSWLEGIDVAFDDELTMIATGYIGPYELETHAQILFEAHGGFERNGDHVLIDPAKVDPTRGATMSGAGANMVIRRELFNAIGGFDEALGAGTPTRTADDKLFFYRTLDAGYRIDYDPSRKVWHRHRRDLPGLQRILRDYGTGEVAWTAHTVRIHRNLAVRRIWQWWARHLVDDLLRWKRHDSAAISPRLTCEEFRGILEGFSALRTVPPVSPAGGPGPGEFLRKPRSVPNRPIPDARVVSDTPTVTVAIGSYNRCAALHRVLEKLNDQSAPTERYEVLVVLDGCTDDSAEMVRSFEASYPLRVYEQPNSGLAVGRNRGAELARHEVVVFLDDDIEPRRDYVAAHAAAHAHRREDTWVMGYFPPLVGHSWMEQASRTWWHDHFRRKADPGHRWSMVDMVDGNSSVPVRLFARTGGFDLDFTGGRRQDYEMGIRLIAAGIPMAFSRDACGDHRVKSDVLSGLNIGVSEGRYDAVTLRKHPASWFELPIAYAPTDRKARRKIQAAGRLSNDRAVAIADRLEAIPNRRLWKQFMTHVWWDRYLTGFAIGAAGHEFEVPSKERAVIDVDLDHPAGLPNYVLAGVDLRFIRNGRAAAPVPAQWPGRQWDWDEVVNWALPAICAEDGSA